MCGNSKVLLNREFMFLHVRNISIKAQVGVTEQISHSHPMMEMSRVGQHKTLSGIMWHDLSI